MAKVLPANAAQAFLDALETSQILSAEALAKIREQHAAAEDPKVVARDLFKEGKITKWQAQQLLGGFTGMVVGNYKMLDQLGVGEMGRVYLAEHVQMQRKVALKVLARKHTSQPQVLRRLLAEARRVAAIEHPNISHIQDVNQDGERYFVVLEYIDGEDLQKHVQRVGKLPAARAWNLIRQTAEGLAHAHSKGIVHGGLKPSNLLVDQQGRVKILDFGLAQLAGGPEETGGDSVDQAALTAKLYRAPEAGKGPADRAADVYSLGATLCFLLTGRAPTEGSASAEQIAAAAPETPPALVALCRQLLAANPAERPGNEQALIAALEAAQTSAPQATAPPPKASAPPPKAAAPAPKTAAPLPTAKALPSAASTTGVPAGEEPAAKAPPPKVKKPLVAKALPSATDSGSMPVASTPAPSAPIVGSPAAAASETPAAAASDTPFGGFAIQTKGRGGKAPAKATSGATPVVTAAASQSPPGVAGSPAATAEGPAPAKGKQGPAGNLPLILAGGIGGGVLVLGLVIGLIMFMAGRGKEKVVAQGTGDEPATTKPTESGGEANPPEANPIVPAESNPTIPAESNPVVPVAPPVAPMPTPMPAPVEPMPPAPTPMPEVKPEPPMVAPVPVAPEVKPEPPPMPKPMPVGNPFEGFSKSVALPKLPTGMSEPTPEMLAAVVLGPCKVPDEATVISALLKGGETANGKAKVKFSLESANGGTSLRDWDIKVVPAAGGTPTLIATVHAKNDQLLFQWKAEAAKQPAAPYLCNCLIELKAGNGKIEFALRQPVSLEPIVIGIEKRTPPFKFNVDLPPEQKQLMFEIIAVEGEVPKVKFDNKNLVAEKETTFFWVGNVETEMPLGMKIDTSIAGGRTVQATFVPYVKLEGMTRPSIYGKKELQQLNGAIEGDLARGTLMIQQSTQVPDAKTKQDLNQQGTLLVEPAQKRKAQFDQMLSLAKSLQNAKMQFRVYAIAEDGKVELATSEGGGGAGPAAPGPLAPVIKAPAGPAGNAGALNPPASPRPRPAPKNAGPARAPIGTTEATAEQVFTESRQSDEFDTQFKGKNFRLTGTVAAIQDTEVHLTGGPAGVVIMKFAKKGDIQGVAVGAAVVIDGEYTQRGPNGPVFQSCEVVK